MGKLLSLIGYVVLAFIVVSNYTGIPLPNTAVILLGIVSAVCMVLGILCREKKK